MSRKKRRQFVYNDLSSKSCVDCGECDQVVLTYDHVRGTKVGNISAMIKNATIDEIKKEINKCEVRCFNCHMRRTALQQSWYKDLQR